MPEIERDGVRLYFSRSGDGPPVLFHTGSGGDGRMWELAGYADVMRDFDRIIIDHRGHGRSDRPVDVESHRWDEYVADVIAVLDAADVPRAVLVGYSSGAAIVFAVAATYPDRCCGVVGIGGLSRPDDVAPRPALIDELRARGIDAVVEDMVAAENESCPTWLVENLKSTDAEMFARQMEGRLDAPSEWTNFASIAAPVLIVCGEHEDGGEAALAAAAVVDGKAMVLANYGHLQTFWHAEVTAPLVRDFVESCYRLPSTIH